jgi:hypothetical protein
MRPHTGKISLLRIRVLFYLSVSFASLICATQLFHPASAKEQNLRWLSQKEAACLVSSKRCLLPHGKIPDSGRAFSDSAAGICIRPYSIASGLNRIPRQCLNHSSTVGIVIFGMLVRPSPSISSAVLCHFVFQTDSFSRSPARYCRNPGSTHLTDIKSTHDD